MHRIGKYQANSDKCRPILVKLVRSVDVQFLLSKAGETPSPMRIQPDLTAQERTIRSVLLRERRSLISSGTDKRNIKLRQDSLYVGSRLYGRVVDGRFACSSPPTSHSTQADHDDESPDLPVTQELPSQSDSGSSGQSDSARPAHPPNSL